MSSKALSSRRSLGNTSLLVGTTTSAIDDTDDDAAADASMGLPVSSSKPQPAAPKAKRYSTAFGTVSTSPQTKDERKKQADVAELYQGVVKRVQENKMTAKNAFMSRMFIDDLDLVLVQAKGSFHKASCAVSTAAEVYCLLVDDLSQSTSMVQELLFNNSSSGANATRGETDGEEARANRKRAVGGGGGGGGGVACTLETNLGNIRSEQVDKELEIDSQFQKLLQGKDTGSQGMLLNLLKVYDGPQLGLDCARIPAFTPPLVEQEAKPKPAGEPLPKDLWSKLLGGASGGAPVFSAGPSFAELRLEADRSLASSSSSSSAAVASSVVDDMRLSVASSVPAAAASTSSRVSRGESEQHPQVEDYDLAGGDFDDDGGGFGDDYDDDNYGGGGGDESAAADVGAAPSAVPFIMRAFDAQAMETDNGKLDTFVIPSDVLIEYQQHEELLYLQQQQQQQPKGDNNAAARVWLGFAHWKAPKPTAAAATSATSVDGTGPAVKRRKTKEVKKIDFCRLKPINERVAFAKPTSARLIQLPKSSATTTTTTKSTTERHLLPVNTHFAVSDLQRFFLRPQQTLRGSNFAMSASASDSASSSEYGRGDDYLGGEDGGGMYGDDYDDDGGGGMDDDGADEHDLYDSEQMHHLVAPAHHVERIRVAYATRAKKVDVKQLKVDLWDTIDLLDPEEEEEEKEDVSVAIPEAAAAAEAEAKVCLSGSIRRTQEHKQQEVAASSSSPTPQSTTEDEVITVPFYFICMLHLANEKGLELHSSQALDDISIFRSAVPTSSSRTSAT